jgi:homoserine/homoserine lactone efflux protein
MDPILYLAFAASFFLISLSPGMCMTLAMSLSIRIGPRRCLWMMWGELLGIALVGSAAMLGVAALFLQSPMIFTLFKGLGSLYLFYLGWQSWNALPQGSQLPMAMPELLGASRLALQGFVTATANPKAWAFFIALLPPFVDQNRPLAPQMLGLISIMMIIEFCCLQAYAQGGRALSEQLHKHGKARWLNRISGGMMISLGFWLLFS